MSFDVDQIKNETDLLSLVSQYTNLVRKGTIAGRGPEYGGPCPKCGGVDRFLVQPEKGICTCRQCVGVDKWLDVIAFIQWIDECSFQDACKKLGGTSKDNGDKPKGKHNQSCTTKQDGSYKPVNTAIPSAIWQSKARKLIQWAEEQLWSNQDALSYLRNRGLSDQTIKDAHLGYCPQTYFDSNKADWGIDDKNCKVVWLPHGWVIPCEVGGVLWYVKVRRHPDDLAKDSIKGRTDKYIAIKGSIKSGALYGGDTLANFSDVILTEGEFNALILRQVVGHIYGVASLGDAGNMPGTQAMTILLRTRRIWARYDLDSAGENGLNKLTGLSKRVRPLPLPWADEDINDAYLAGRDLLMWVTESIGKEADKQPQKEDPPSSTIDDSGPIVHQADDGGAAENSPPPAASAPPTDEQIRNLEQRIMAAFTGRQVPIQLSRAETITDVGRFARGAARSYFSSCKWVQRTAADHLRALGIEAESITGDKSDE